MTPSVVQEPWPWQAQEGFPWDGVHYFHGQTPLVTDAGMHLSEWGLAYEEWGPSTGDPVVVFHALTGDSHVATHHARGPLGWWEGVVGPGAGLDTNRFHVLSFNVLGGAMGSTGPSSRDPEGRPWGSRFPHLTLFDMARAAHELVAEWHAGRVRIIGGSMGGMLAYAYAALFPDEVSAVMAVGAPIAHEPWAIAFHSIGRRAIVTDPHFQGGDYYEGPYPESGLAIARMADMVSYQHPESMAQKFGRGRQPPKFDDFQITSYLHYQGQKLVSRFDANTYLTLTLAMDAFSLSPEHLDTLARTPIWMVGMLSDVLYFPQELEMHREVLTRAGVSTRLAWISGPWGHDTFLVNQQASSAMVAEFLENSAT